MIPALIEAGLRALAVALTVWAGFRLLRVRNVLAQKAAWGLVLAAAVAMPLVMRWQWLPNYAQLRLTAPEWRQEAVAAPATSAVPLSANSAAPVQQFSAVPESEPAGGSRFPAPTVSSGVLSSDAQVQMETTTYSVKPETRRASSRLFRIAMLGEFLYFAVCAALLSRLVYGFGSAVRLWLAAEPVVLKHCLDIAEGLSLRASAAVFSPVTIGSGVILPEDYANWDAEKLRIVLAHERSHVRQGDFYLQILAGIYASVFWFSPLGWWLKQKLADLAEAISDRAGVEEAASRASYAQVLLEFAVMPRPTLIGVAMARTSNLSHRIERLLNESSFSQAFAGSRRRALLAILLVPVALVACTALIRVEAAGQEQQQPAPPVQTGAPLAGQAHPDQAPDAIPIPPAAPNSADREAPVAPLPPVAPADAAPQAAQPPQPPEPPDHSDDTIIVGKGQSLTITNGRGDTVTNTNDASGHDHMVRRGYSYRYSSDGDDTMALVTGNGNVSGSGQFGKHFSEVRGKVHGDFVYYEHDGHAYVIDDPAFVAQAKALYKPMEELGRQQEALGKKQEELGRQQEELGRKQELANVPTPDVSKEMAELNAAVARLQAKKGSTISEEQLSEIEGKIGDLQGKLGDLQGRIGDQQGRLGELQGKLGEQQGKLGEEQGRLGEQQGRLGEEADRKLKSMIDESVRNGKARPVE